MVAPSFPFLAGPNSAQPGSALVGAIGLPVPAVRALLGPRKGRLNSTTWRSVPVRPRRLLDPLQFLVRHGIPNVTPPSALNRSFAIPVNNWMTFGQPVGSAGQRAEGGPDAASGLGSGSWLTAHRYLKPP